MKWGFVGGVTTQSITELRRKEIGSLADENAHHDEYEFIYGEENVWYVLRIL